jgi:hypothetical protein
MTEKQVVPKYMADWLKFCKDNGFKLLEGMSPYASAMEEYLDDFEGDIQEVLKWIRHNPDEFARAWLNGYKVASPTKYKVFIKGLKKENNYLKHNIGDDSWYMGANMDGENHILWHTKEDLEKAGFVWVFSCEGVIVEEMQA